MVSEDGEHRAVPGKPGDGPLERRLSAPVREQIACDRDEVGIALLRPAQSALEGEPVQRELAEVEVGQVEDPQAVELGWEPGERELELGELDPLGLEGRPGERRSRDAGGRDERRGQSVPASSFRRTGATETT